MSDAETRERRLRALRDQMRDAGVALAALAPTDNLRWLLGFSPLYDERACLLIVGAQRSATLMPSLNAEQVAAEVPELELVRWADEDGPEAALRAVLERVDAGGGADGGRTLVIADPEMRADHLLLLQDVLPRARTRTALPELAALREVKDGDEIAALQRSSDLADQAVRAGLDACAPGVTERQVAEAIAAAFTAGGATPHFGIVAGGPHGAFPHHETGDRPLVAGEPVLLDIGGELRGYQSDITRMGFLGEPSERYREIHAIVEAAVAAGIAAVAPGATCGDVDTATRQVIDDAGYGEFFVHRTGHGLGLSGHEPPWIMRGNDAELRVGNVFSVEPGIYLPGEFGIRLEEIVHVTPAGGERFSALPRAVETIG